MSGCRWCGSTGRVGAKKQHVCEECGGAGKLYTEAEVALLRRQVEVLCRYLANDPTCCVDPYYVCPGDCVRHWSEWSAAKAKEGV